MIHRTQQSTLLLPIYCKRYNSGTVKWKRCIRECGCPCGSTTAWHINMLTNPETLQAWFRSFIFIGAWLPLFIFIGVWLIVPLYVCAQLLSHVRLSPPGSSVHEIFQARILEWVAIPFSRGSSQPRDRTQVSCIAGGFFTMFFIMWATRAHIYVCVYIYIYIYIIFKVFLTILKPPNCLQFIHLDCWRPPVV